MRFCFLLGKTIFFNFACTRSKIILEKVYNTSDNDKDAYWFCLFQKRLINNLMARAHLKIVYDHVVMLRKKTYKRN